MSRQRSGAKSAAKNDLRSVCPDAVPAGADPEAVGRDVDVAAGDQGGVQRDEPSAADQDAEQLETLVHGLICGVDDARAVRADPEAELDVASAGERAVELDRSRAGVERPDEELEEAVELLVRQEDHLRAVRRERERPVGIEHVPGADHVSAHLDRRRAGVDRRAEELELRELDLGGLIDDRAAVGREREPAKGARGLQHAIELRGARAAVRGDGVELDRVRNVRVGTEHDPRAVGGDLEVGDVSAPHHDIVQLDRTAGQDGRAEEFDHVVGVLVGAIHDARSVRGDLEVGVEVAQAP